MVGRVARFDPARYERETYSKRGGNIISERETSSVLELSNVSADSTVLEVGVGSGRIAKGLAAMGANMVGLDVDSRMIGHFADMRRLLDQGEPAIELIVASGQYLPFRRGVFDVIVCIRVFRYFECGRKALADMCNSLKPRGRLVLEAANIFRLQTVIQLPQLVLGREFYPRLFLRKTVQDWVSSNGMRVNDVTGWHKIPPEILRLSDNRVFLQILVKLETELQKILPPDVLSRSIVISATKS